jgi:O-antigen/teichoic acid export membrane protein
MVVGTLTMLVVVTVLGRTLSLSEFGLYGLLISFPSYLLMAQMSVETAAVSSLAKATTQLERDRVVTTAVALYLLVGLITALMVVFGGWALLGVFGISHRLEASARDGLLLIGLVNLVSWPLKTALDVLRGSQRFVACAVAESAALLTFGLLMLLAIVLDAPLSILAGLGGSLSLLIGVWAAIVLRTVDVPFRLRTSTLSLRYARTFMSISAYLFISGIADLVIYSLDRVVLGAFRPVATIGLYEGPMRAHNLVRQLQGTLVLTVMPAAAGYIAVGDHTRLRDLLVRGTRYVMLVTVPLTVTFMVLSGPILSVWLGGQFDKAALAMTILVSYWLIAAASAVGGAMLVAAGRARLVAIFITCVAIASLALSLALTPSLGLDGLVLGTSIPNALMAPIILWIYCRTFDVAPMRFVREALIPAYYGGLLLALVEIAGRRLFDVFAPLGLALLIASSLALYAFVVYTAWLHDSERRLIRTVLAGVGHRALLIGRASALPKA